MAGFCPAGAGGLPPGECLKVLHSLLVHQSDSEVQAILAAWRSVLPRADLLLLHGGENRLFEGIQFKPKTWVEDPWLRTVRHPPEKQSYRALFGPVATHLRQGNWSHVALWEGDHFPLVGDVEERLLARAAQEQADVLGYALQRIDQTNDPHLLFHRKDPEFEKYFRSISRRKDPSVILSFLGTGSFWTKEAWEAMSKAPPGPRIYLEIDLPTTIHHLGFRVAGMGEQDRFVRPEPASLPRDCHEGWSIHPVKMEVRSTLRLERGPVP
jgi:hypothetical protein